MTSPNDDERPLMIVMTPAQFRAAVREAVREELATHTKPPAAMLSPRTAAELLGVTSRTVVNLLTRGELRGTRVGSSWRIRRVDVEAYLEANRAA